MSAAPSRRASERQRALFEAVARCGEVVVATGPMGISANLVGTARLRAYGDEDRLDVDDGTHHVHVDWSRVRRAEVSESDGEGLLALFDGDEPLFRVYRMEGPFPDEVRRLADGALR